MYKVLIADDEDIIRRGLSRFVEQDRDFRVVAQAEDGLSALEAVRMKKPDLALIDINMPFLDGLTITEQMLRENPHMLVVIITGYDDFQFVQKALRLGVFDYILKPVKEHEFFPLLGRIKEKLVAQRSNEKYLDWAKEQLERCRPSIVEKFMNKWVYGHLDEIEFQERLRYLELELPEQYTVAAIKLHGNFDGASSLKEIDWDDNLLYFACQNIVQELYAPMSKTTCFRTTLGELIVISDFIPASQWERLNTEIRDAVDRCLNVDMLIARMDGIRVSTIPDAVEQALKQLDSRQHYSNVVMQTIQYVDRDIANSELSLREIAESMFVSPQHLSRIFKQETGDTFGAYLAQTRVQKAMVLLRDPKLKMYEIAAKTGFSSQHYFSSSFKKLLGISPVEYRKTVLGNSRDKKEP